MIKILFSLLLTSLGHVCATDFGQPALNNAFCMVARTGDVQIMKELIHAGADVNSFRGADFPKHGRRALVEAIDSGSVDAVKLLLENGAQVEYPSDVPEEFNVLEPTLRAFNSLSYAIMVNASIEIIKLLIKYFQDSNAKDGAWMPHGGWSPYQVAKQCNNLTAIEALLLSYPKIIDGEK